MEEHKTNKLVKGALLLTFAGFVSKLLSAGYRIPLQNLTGDLGFYIYQQVYPLLGIILVLSLYGFPSAISMITSELKTAGKKLSWKVFYLPILSILIGVSSIVALILYLSAGSIADWIGDDQLTNAYQLAALFLLFIPFSILLRGVFQGISKMKPTASSQVGEQLVRVTIIIYGSYLYFTQRIDVYAIGEVAAFASIAGSVTAIVILGIFFIKIKPMGGQEFSIPWSYYFRIILSIGVVASLNHMLLLILQLADVLTLVPHLVEHGLPQLKAMEVKGVFDRGQPLIQLGTVLGSSFALALIPVISKKNLKKDPQHMNQSLNGALLFSFYLAAGATIGLITIFPETNILLFQDTRGTVSLQILSISIFLGSIAITVSSILQGLGCFKRTAGFVLLAFAAKWMMNTIFVPWWGITGSAIATVSCLLLLCVLALVELKRELPKLRFIKRISWWSLFKASFGMVVYIQMVHFLTSTFRIHSRLELLLYIIFIAITGAIIYMIILLRSKTFTKQELSMLPFSSIFIRLHKE